MAQDCSGGLRLAIGRRSSCSRIPRNDNISSAGSLHVKLSWISAVGSNDCHLMVWIVDCPIKEFSKGSTFFPFASSIEFLTQRPVHRRKIGHRKRHALL